MQLKLIITDAVQFFLRNLKQIAVVCLPWLLAGAMVEYLIVVNQEQFGDAPMVFVSMAFNLLVYPIYTASLILLMARQAEGQRPDNRELFNEALKRWQPLLILHLLGSLLIGFGIFLFVLPALWFLVRLAFAEYYLVLDNLNPIEAIQKSIQSTRKHWVTILLLMLMFMVPAVGLTFYVTRVLPDTAQGNAMIAIIGTATSFYLLFVEVLIFRVFMQAVEDAPGEPPAEA